MNRHIADKAFQYLHWIFSIFVAVCIYVILYFLFYPEKTEIIMPVKQVSKIMMLPLYSNKNSTPNDRYLKTWIHFNDPSLVIRPDYSYGYSSVLSSRNNMPYLDSTLDLNRKLTEQSIFATDILTSPIETEKEPATLFLSRLMPFRYPLPQSPFDTSSSKQARFPYATGVYSGDRIPVDFLDMNKIQALLKKHPDAKPMTLELTFPESAGLFPEVNIIYSSGVPELDKIAVNSLTVSDLHSKMEHEPAGEKLYIDIQWKKNYN